ncbi:MAG: class I SAM-dependent methyltransferase [Ignavibacteriales bacterium]|nr:class I SAM-dependent methyltransferase [Ignavibacteriales bacterium]
MSSSVPKLKAFDEFASEYDRWFDSHAFAYQSEVEAIHRFVPEKGLGVEIGVGTGRFSVPFSITIGVEPSEAMAAIARSRGMRVHLARAEQLPFESEHFDFALMVTTLCFVEDPQAALSEAYRILKPAGSLILAIIDKNTPLGKTYESMKAVNKFYREATFYTTGEVLALLRQECFAHIVACQTIFSNPETMNAPDNVRDGYGEGAFVVFSAVKINQGT